MRTPAKQVFETPPTTCVWAGFAKPDRLFKGLQSDPGPAIRGRIRNALLGAKHRLGRRSGSPRRVAIAALLAVALVGCETVPEDSPELSIAPLIAAAPPGTVELAERAFAEARFGDAKRLLDRVLIADPGNPSLDDHRAENWRLVLVENGKQIDLVEILRDRVFAFWSELTYRIYIGDS